jgi:hypothetical protein
MRSREIRESKHARGPGGPKPGESAKIPTEILESKSGGLPDYTRANASICVNGTVLNNVAANTVSLEERAAAG